MHQRATRWLLVVLCCYGFALAQSSPDVEQGMKAFGSYSGGAIDHISLSNGNAFVQGNLFNYSQRGGEFAYPVTFQYNNKAFSQYQTPCQPGTKLGTFTCPLRITILFGPNPLRSMDRSNGNTATVGYEGLPSVGSSGTIDTTLQESGREILVSSLSVVTPDGSTHQLVKTDTGMTTVDGSGFFLNSKGNLLDRNGTLLTGGLGTLAQDRNGNQISFNSSGVWEDTVGRPIPPAPEIAPTTVNVPASTASLGSCPVLDYEFQPASYAYTWNLPTTNGGTLPLVLCYTPVWVRTGTSNSPPIFDVNQAFYMLQSVVLPDKTYWAFQYDAADPNTSTSLAYGDLLKITFPTGGSISYTWAGTTLGSCVGGRFVQTRIVDANDGTVPQKWTYTRAFAVVNGQGTETVTVTDPLKNDTVHTFTALGDGITRSCSYYETGTQYYQGAQGAGTLLKTVQTDYQWTPNPYDSVLLTGGVASEATSVINVFPTHVTTTLPNGLVSEVDTVYDNAITYHGPLDGLTYNIKECPSTDPGGNDNSDCHYYFYGDQRTNPVTNYTASYGKPTAVREYDWGQGKPGPLLRQTVTTYEWQVNGAYLTANLMDLPATVKIADGAGHLCAETDYFYDEPGYLSAPIPAITTQHATPTTVRGNLTTIDRKLSNTPCADSASWTDVISHNHWFDTGELQSSTDPLGHLTTHLYDPAYAGAYPTETCNSLGQCVSGTYDFNTGLPASFTNENASTQASGSSMGDAAHTSTFSYDDLWRLTQALSPPDLANNNAQDYTKFSYPPTATFPETVTRQKSVTNELADTLTANFDGVGRMFETQHTMPAGPPATVDTVYNPRGEVASVSNPYFSKTDPTYGTTQTQYDALGRVTQVTAQDGSVSKVDYSQYPTVTTTDQAGNMRRTRTDALGRLVEVDEPGAGANSPGLPGTGTINVSGSLASTTTSTKATGSFTVNGSEQLFATPRLCKPDPVTGNFICDAGTSTYDSGSISVTVNGFTSTTNYGQGDTTAGLARVLAAGFNVAGSPVSANYPGSGSTVYLTANQPGPDYAMSQASSTSQPVYFDGPSFASTLSGTALTGGAYPVTTYDSGTLTVTVDGFKASASYNQSLNNNPTTLAGSLALALNGSGSPVMASPSGTTITLTARTVGTATDYTVTGSSTRSFTASGATLGKGTNPTGIDAPLVTLYQYDGLGNLLCVEQHGGVSGTGCSSAPSSDATSPWRVRRFTYDSLGRLLTAHNPESGTITYSYDLDGNLLQKISPAPNQTGTATQIISYCYDALHRVIGKAYSEQSCPLSTPAVTYSYDVGPNAIGHLTGVTDQAGSASYSYDVLGRLASEARVMNGISKSLSYDYNLDGSLKALHYPSGAIISYTPDSAGRFTSVVDSINSINYVTSAAYQADGQITGFVSGYGATLGGITSTFTYNKRLQPVNISANTPSQTVFSIGYDFHLGAGDNGNVFGITNYKDMTRSQSFTYDQLNRLTSAQNAGTNCAATTVNGKTEYWGNSYGYDAWGNLADKTITKCGAENFHPGAASVSNQLPGYGYDAAGNMTSDPTDGVNSIYDAENRIVAVNTTQGLFAYTYGADGNRVAKSGTGTGTLYWYMTPGMIGESDLSGVMKSEYVFFNGQRVARRDYPSGSVAYYFSDHLKTASVITDSAGNIKSESDYYPWGGELQLVSNDPNKYKFTGAERDSESGLDRMGARYYSNGFSRFTTPDPLMIQKQKLFDPQQWNMYQYSRNNPLRYADPSGLYVCADSAKCDSKQDKAFEKARQHDLKSRDANVVRGAAAYGAPTRATGITLTFGEPKNGKAGNTTTGTLEPDPDHPGTYRAVTTVTLKNGLSGTALDAAVAHEGTHVADAQAFAATVSSDLMHYDYSKNLTQYQTEVNAYRVTQAVQATANETASYGQCAGGPCNFGPGIRNIDQVINQLLANPANNYNLTPDNPGARQFPAVPPPPNN
ncbi:MAG TPA: RHS repeat-associated core domain-containing protein [Candidatus Angelobacter sp.]|nr:RHS repeat-associated core domain-containing protein [Candidatus Angelobacter sp.]